MKDAMLFDAVDEFFDSVENWELMSKVIKHKGRRGGVSLRLLDFLCTVYAYREPCMVCTADGSMVPLLEVYETSLDAYGKSHYDCFRRTARMTMEKHGERLHTTLGQLLFFKDIIKNGVLQFADENKEDIKTAMCEQKTSRQAMSGVAATKKKTKQPVVFPVDQIEHIVPPVFSC